MAVAADQAMERVAVTLAITVHHKSRLDKSLSNLVVHLPRKTGMMLGNGWVK
jgi:hypothetical protein